MKNLGASFYTFLLIVIIITALLYATFDAHKYKAGDMVYIKPDSTLVVIDMLDEYKTYWVISSGPNKRYFKIGEHLIYDKNK